MFTIFEASSVILARREEELEKLALNDSLPKVAKFFAYSFKILVIAFILVAATIWLVQTAERKQWGASAWYIAFLNQKRYAPLKLQIFGQELSNV